MNAVDKLISLIRLGFVLLLILFVPQSCIPVTALASDANYLGILDELEGFGRKTTGGKEGKVVVVTTLKDVGLGSLRTALAQKGPKWIVFEEGLSGTIKNKTMLYLSGDTTIDGRGADITLSGEALVVSGKENSNVIITNLKFRNARRDAIRLEEQAQNIWIHRNSFSKGGDGLIDVTTAAKKITISWNTFSKHTLGLLLGRSCKEDDKGDEVMKITLHHNYFDGVEGRSPKVNCGKTHTYNNYNHRWRNVAARVEKGGEIYSEANIYEAGSTKRASNYSSPGYLKSVDDLMQNGAYHHATGSGRVFKPSRFYPYEADKADEKLKSKILTRAGWQNVLRPLDLQAEKASRE